MALLSELGCGFDDILQTDVELIFQRNVVLVLMLLIPGTKTYSHAKQHTLLFTEPAAQSQQAQSVHCKQQTAHVAGSHLPLMKCQIYTFRSALFAYETSSLQLVCIQLVDFWVIATCRQRTFTCFTGKPATFTFWIASEDRSTRFSETTVSTHQIVRCRNPQNKNVSFVDWFNS